jgi:hypothetical protein
MEKTVINRAKWIMENSELPIRAVMAEYPRLFDTPGMVRYNTIQYNTIQYNTIQYNTIQYNTIQYNTTQYNKMSL